MSQLKRDIIARILLLLGFLILLFSLITTHRLTLYVHPRGVNLIKIAGYVLLIMLLMQCYKLKNAWTQSIGVDNKYKIYWKYSPFILTLLVAFILPNSSLNASLVNNKGLNSQIATDLSKVVYRPLATELQQTNFIKVSDQNFIEVMTEMNRFPQEYIGKQIEMKGFISKTSSTSAERFSVVRYVVGCCVGDASPYGLLCATDDAAQYADGSWYQIQGVIETNEYQGKNFPLIAIKWSKKIDDSNTPYIFP